MNDLIDLELPEGSSQPGPQTSSTVGGPEGPEESGGGLGKVLLITFLLLVLAGGAAWYFLRPAPPPPPVAPQPAAEIPTPPPEAPQPVAPAFQVPDLEASDEVLRRLVAELSSHPELVRWLASEGLVRRFAAAVVNVAEGQIPRVHVPFLAPKEKFAARLEENGTVRLDPEGFRRYEPTVDVLTSLDTAGTAELLRKIQPLLQQAYSELGYPDRSFDDALRTAARQVLTTPVPDRPIDLAPQILSYDFADPGLEARPPIQKLLIRMGPENTRRIQEKVREIWEELGL